MTTIKRNIAGGRSPGESDLNGEKAARPKISDMELMLYYDGELEEERVAEVEAYIEQNIAAKRKLSGLRATSGLVRERALSSDINFDMAASVMSAIESGADTSIGKEGAGAKVVPLDSARRAVAKQGAPANDNSRGIFRLAAIAVAAAAAMFVWGRMGADPAPSANNTAPAVTQAAPATPPPAASEEVAPAEPQSADSESEHGVEVAAVDFGAHMGTIFYVPTGAAVDSSTTTVVWVDDEK